MCCGKRNFGSDWIHIDGGDYDHISYKDVTSLPFNDNEVDLIYCSHGIAYWDRVEIELVFKEWKRVLKKGAILRIATPDFDTLAKVYRSGSYQVEDILGPLFGKMKMKDVFIYHKTTYDFNSLSKLLHSSGFVDIKRYDWRETEHAQFDDHSQAYLPKMQKDTGILISLNVECRKSQL